MGLRRHRYSGFTIVELIVVITIVAILAAITVLSIGAWRTNVLKDQVKNELNAASQSLENSRNFGAAYPSSLPTTYDPSEDVVVTLTLSTATDYCLDGASSLDESVAYYLYSKTLDQGPLEGTCDGRPDLNPPGAPATVAVSGSTTSSLTVEWESVSDTDSYLVQCANDAAFIQNLQQVSVNHPTTTAVVGGFAVDTTLFCRVKAVNDKGGSAWSARVSGQTGAPPSAPVVAVSLSGFTSAEFSWPAVPGAVSYTFQYRLDGGSWVVGLEEVDTLTYTVQAGHNQVVDARVVAINAQGAISSYGTNSITTQLWSTLTYQNNWSSYGGSYATGSYTRTSAGVIVLRGLLKRTGSVVVGETIAVLPAGYRPQYVITFMTEISGGDSAAIKIYPTGEIVASTNANATATSLDRIAFITSSAFLSQAFTGLSLLNGWSNSPEPDAPLGYKRDPLGRVFVQGRIEPGTTSSGTAVANLPSSPTDTSVSPKLIVAVRSGSGGHNAVDVGSSIAVRGTGVGTVLYPQLMYYPDSLGASWTNMSLENGWIIYSAISNASPQYIKASDGIVTLKGLIKSGTTTNGVVLFTLPVGYRPTGDLVFPTVCGGEVSCRIDVQADGDVVGRGLVSSWVSLSGINFVAEQ